MTRKEIIDGLKMTMDLITFDPSTGEDIDPDDLNNLNRTTYDACKGAVELLEVHDETQLSGESTTKDSTSDCISRQDTIRALWKALYDYEDKTEKQFKESDELDIRDWTVHRIFVQNMSDIDRKTIIEMPSAQPEPHWIPVSERLPEDEYVLISKKSTKISGDKWSVTIAIRTADPRSRKIQWRDIGFGVIQDDKVLAWMPLPEGYRGEQDG